MGDDVQPTGAGTVITSYSIHYTKLYDLERGGVRSVDEFLVFINCERSMFGLVKGYDYHGIPVRFGVIAQHWQYGRIISGSYNFV